MVQAFRDLVLRLRYLGFWFLGYSENSGSSGHLGSAGYSTCFWVLKLSKEFRVAK